jgi:two-component system sensor histidine kinase GlrK
VALRFRRPRTLLGLTLVALGLVTLPLLIGAGNAMLNLNDLMEQSRVAVRASEDWRTENQLIERALTNMRRYALQHISGLPQSLEFLEEQQTTLTESLSALARLEHPATVDADIAQLRTSLGVVDRILADPATTDTLVEQQFAGMSTVASSIEVSMEDAMASRMEQITQDVRAAQRSLLWQAAALIPGTLILVLLFILLVGRPMRQIDRAIRELGKGDYANPIAVSGPTDIETLGRQLEWLRHRLAESTEEKNKFLRHMSHELKTPLANIREGTELLLDGSVGALDRQQQEVTGILRENSVKLQRLIENLLTFSAWQAKTATLAISEFELKPLVFSVLSLHRLVISSREIKLHLEVAPIKVRADEGKIRLVLENLLSNALKFTPENGAIAIRAAMEGSDLVLEVADSGPGVAAEDAPRIFEAFYQGRRPQGGQVGGTGIGLSVVHECVQAHGGTVALVPQSARKSARGEMALRGAHFVVRLPLRRADDRPKLVVSNA